MQIKNTLKQACAFLHADPKFEKLALGLKLDKCESQSKDGVIGFIFTAKPEWCMFSHHLRTWLLLVNKRQLAGL